MGTHNEDTPLDSSNQMTEDEIDDALKESFPASDPPPWTLGVDPHQHEEEDEKK